MTSPQQLNFTQDNQPSNTIDIVEATSFIDYLRQTLECVLVIPLDNYLNQVHTNKASSQLEAFSTEILYERATAETAHQMELSQSVTPQELEELINKSTSKAVATLSKEIQSLKSKLANAKKSSNNQNQKDSSKAKNKPRGARSSASSKNKSTNPDTSNSRSPTSHNRGRSRSPKTHNQNRQGNRNNGSSKGSKNKTNKSNRSNSVKKRRTSSTNSRRNSKK